MEQFEFVFNNIENSKKYSKMFSDEKLGWPKSISMKKISKGCIKAGVDSIVKLRKLITMAYFTSPSVPLGQDVYRWNCEDKQTVVEPIVKWYKSEDGNLELRTYLAILGSDDEYKFQKNCLRTIFRFLRSRFYEENIRNSSSSRKEIVSQFRIYECQHHTTVRLLREFYSVDDEGLLVNRYDGQLYLRIENSIIPLFEKYDKCFDTPIVCLEKVSF